MDNKPLIASLRETLESAGFDQESVDTRKSLVEELRTTVDGMPLDSIARGKFERVFHVFAPCFRNPDRYPVSMLAIGIARLRFIIGDVETWKFRDLLLESLEWGSDDSQ